MTDATNTMLETTKITALIRKFALPAILSNLVGSIYNIADQIFVGQKLGTVGNAATNIAFPLVLLMATVYVTIGSGVPRNSAYIKVQVKRTEQEKLSETVWLPWL